MASRKHARQTLAADLDALQGLSDKELKERWADLYGSACPPRMSRIFLLRALAYRIQEQVSTLRINPGCQTAVRACLKRLPSMRIDDEGRRPGAAPQLSRLAMIELPYLGRAAHPGDSCGPDQRCNN